MEDTNLAALGKQCMTSLYLCSDNISKYLKDEKEVEFAKLKSYVEDYCKLEAQQDVAIQALEMARSETNAENMDSLEHKFNTHRNSLTEKRLDIANHPYMLDIIKRIKLGMRNIAAMFFFQTWKNSDLAVNETENRPIDPITKRPIEDPVRNSVCSHVYERASIMELLRVNRKTKCPVAGCGNRQPVKTQHLTSDDQLQFHLAANAHSTIIQPQLFDLDDTM